MGSSPVRAPKLQLAVDQPSAGGHWNKLKKDTPHPKTKKKVQWDCRMGTVTMKSNPISSGWATHKLENNNTKEVGIYPWLWRFLVPHQASQPGDPTKRLGIPKESDFEGQWDLITGLPHAWGKQTPLLEHTNQDPGERSSDLTGDWPRLTCWCWGGTGQQWLAVGRGVLAAAVLEGIPWHKSSWRLPLTLPSSPQTTGLGHLWPNN